MIDKAGVVEKILSRLGLWVENERGPSIEIRQAEYEEVIKEAFNDGWTVNEKAEKYA